MRAADSFASGLFFVLAMVFTATTAHAQSAARASNDRAPSQPQKHRFLDSLNLGLTTIEASALAADGFYTQRGLRRYPGVLFEANPVARPFVSRGWPGMIAGGALFISADLGIRYLLHRSGHHRVERWVPAMLIGSGTFGALSNVQLIRRTQRALQDR